MNADLSEALTSVVFINWQRGILYESTLLEHNHGSGVVCC
jgi:hypothetical protein